jgi:ferric-dicitrate binding protein FerR (iron transport regulator)
MKPSEWIRLIFIIAAFLNFTVAQTGPQPETVLPVGSAVVTEMKGDAVFTSVEGIPIAVQRGATLYPDTKIETAKGSVLLELQDGSQVLIKSHSSVVLRAPNQGNGYALELFIGKILAKIQKRLGGAPSFRMGTPSAVITVRGTRFSVEVNRKHKTYVEVYEGLVQVSGLTQGSREVLIRPGFFTGIEIERGPEEPREINPHEGRGDRENEGPGGMGRNEEKQRTQPRTPTQGEGGSKPD